MWTLGGWPWPPPSRPSPLFEIGSASGAENPGPGTYEVAPPAAWGPSAKPHPPRAKNYAPLIGQSHTHTRVCSAKQWENEIGPGHYECRSDWGSGRGAVCWHPATPRQPPPSADSVRLPVSEVCDEASDASAGWKHPGAPLPGWARRLFDYHRSLKDGCPLDVEITAASASRTGKRAAPSGHQWSDPRGGYKDSARFPGKARRDPRRWTVETVVRHRGTVRPPPPAHELKTIGASLGLKMLASRGPNSTHRNDALRESLAEDRELSLLPDDSPSHKPEGVDDVDRSTRVTVAAYVPNIFKTAEAVAPAGASPPVQHRQGTAARPPTQPVRQARPRAEHRAHTMVGLCVGEARSPAAVSPAHRGNVGASDGRGAGLTNSTARGRVLEQRFHSVSAAEEDLGVLVGKIEVKHRVLRKNSSMQSHVGRPGSEQSIPVEAVPECASSSKVPESQEPDQTGGARSSPLRVPQVLTQAPASSCNRGPQVSENSWPGTPLGGVSTPVSEARWRRVSASPDPAADGNGSDFSGSPSEELL